MAFRLAVMMVAVMPSQAQDAPDPSSVLLEVPIMAQAPGFHELVRSYHDGARFFVDAVSLLELLGYSVTPLGLQLSAADAERELSMDFLPPSASELGAAPLQPSGDAFFVAGRYLLAIEGLSDLFGEDVFFDEASLTLTLSSTARQFDTFALGSHASLGGEVPGPVQYGRERTVLGGFVAAWNAQWQWHWDQPAWHSSNLHFSSSMLGGSVRGSLGGSSELTYLFDRPGSPYLTRIEAGRMAVTGGQMADAVRLSNLPLASLRLQRTVALHGSAASGSVAEAAVGGQVIDRTKVGPDGRYRLRVPAYYGSTEAVVRIRPLGGASAYEERHYLFTTPALVPQGQLFYDAVLGRGGSLHVRYGIGARLSARVTGNYGGTTQAGLVASPLPFMVVAADVGWPLRLVQASAHFWRRRLNAEVGFTGHSDQKHGHILVSAQWRAMSMQLTGVASESPARLITYRLSPSIGIHRQGGLFVRAQAHIAHQGPLAWQGLAGMSRLVWGKTGYLGLDVQGTDQVHSAGLEVRFTTRRIALGVTVRYDSVTGRVGAVLNAQGLTDFLGLTTRASSNGTHTHSAYGSISVGPGLRFSRGLRDEAAALLRIFEDVDGDGQFGATEAVLRGVEVQVFHATVSRTESGALLAQYLEPYASYQVHILENSIHDPWLRPVPGYAFSFVADPGRTKVVDIPLQRIPLVRGEVTALDRPASRLRVRATQEGKPDRVADVYRDGGFALRLTPGTYVLQLMDAVTEELLREVALDVPPGTRTLDIVID